MPADPAHAEREFARCMMALRLEVTGDIVDDISKSHARAVLAARMHEHLFDCLECAQQVEPCQRIDGLRRELAAMEGTDERR